MAPHTPALFLADSPGLDFLNSVATPVDTEVDRIEDGAGLLAWLEQAELVSPDTLASLRERAMPGEFDTVAARARSLREEFRKFVLEHKGRPLGAESQAELAPLNRLLARDEAFLQLDFVEQHNGPALQLRRARRRRSPDALLLPIGEALAGLLAEEDFSDVKACEGPACTLMFADHTRGRVRRWCSMAICGNRVKQTAHRNRFKQIRDTAGA
ncbi:CGNR zinc finger domain-containing protein [Streptomyces sp. NPDC056652]|uniref:CGNR zinc finger domain-containing protein n=1 Tax=Streptomyces sp. NPDC056652 TaxID=3345893 RepID=UPI0036B04743